MKDTHKISDLAHLKLLSDPLKLSLLQAFAEGPRTTRQVADDLGEKITKLYRHVDALHEAGLLEVVAEQQKRGTVERTFKAVARRFEVDHELFADAGDDAAAATIRDALRATETEVLDSLRNYETEDHRKAMFLRIRCKASPERIKEMQESLNAWIEAAQEDDDGEETEEIGALIAFYPLARKT